MRNLIIFFSILISGSLFAQTDSTSTGEVVDAEIIIEKNKKIVLPQADKISAPVEIKSFILGPLKLTYQVVEPDFNFPDYKSEISFIEVKEKYPRAKFQNYISAGYGNFQSPLLELGLFHRLQAVNLGAKIFHESFGSGPIGDTNSASSTSSLDLSARYKNDALEVVPTIRYTRRGYRFYGNTDRINSGFTDNSPEEVASANFEFAINLKGQKKGLTYYLDPKIISISQSLIDGNDINKEAGVVIDAGFDFQIDKKVSTGIDIEGYSGKYIGGLEYNRSFFTIRPKISRITDDLELNAGFTLTSGSIDDTAESGIYPFVNGSLKFAPKWSLYGGFDGGVKWNGLNQLLSENLFLDDSLAIRNTNLISSINGGIKGNPISSVQLKAEISHSNYENLPFYVPSENDSSKFVLSYDGGTTSKFTFLSELNVTVNSSTIMGVNLEFYGYTLESLEKAWHLPDYSISVYFSQNIKNKLLINAAIIAIGGIDAPVNTSTTSVKLESFVDMNLSATYRVTDRISIFMKLNNLLGNEYEKFIGYPVRSAMFKLGGSYRF